MATLTIRNVPDETKRRLRIRAAEHGHSMEAELRAIVERALESPKPAKETGLGERIHRRFAKLGGVELKLPERTPAREPLDFGE
jgi:plasmid stability protein